MKLVTFKAGQLLYHGTVNSFSPEKLILPAWFSVDIDQAHNHIAYKYYGQKDGKIIIYKNLIDLNLIDISNDGDFRLFVNEHGNKKLADYIQKGVYGDDIHGYINFPEQKEIMICKYTGNIDYFGEKSVELVHKVYYKRLGKDWKMEKEKKKKACCIIN